MAGRYSRSTQALFWKNQKSTRNGAVTWPEDLPEQRIVFMHLKQQMSKLGKKLFTRQRVLSTAHVFVLRFYSRVGFGEANPYLVLVTSLYLASKIEECPQHIRVIANEARSLWPEGSQIDTAKIGEYEFWIISELDSQMIVHHPYQFLSDLQIKLALPQERLALAWSVVNDHYVTHMPLECAPGDVAAAAVVLSCTMRPTAESGRGAEASAAENEKLIEWMIHSDYSMEVVSNCVQQMISLYTVLDGYDDRRLKEQLHRFVREHKL